MSLRICALGIGAAIVLSTSCRNWEQPVDYSADRPTPLVPAISEPTEAPDTTPADSSPANIIPTDFIPADFEPDDVTEIGGDGPRLGPHPGYEDCDAATTLVTMAGSGGPEGFSAAEQRKIDEALKTIPEEYRADMVAMMDLFELTSTDYEEIPEALLDGTYLITAQNVADYAQAACAE